MRPQLTLSLASAAALLLSSGCGKPSANTGETPSTDGNPDSAPVESTPAPGPARSVVRINSTLQTWNPWQPWEKNEPTKRRALGAIVAPGLVLTTAEMCADAIFIELESIDGTRLLPAKTRAIDYESNLAMLEPEEASAGAPFFAGTEAFAIAETPSIGDGMEIIQVESNGSLLQTGGKLQSVGLSSPLVGGAGFLTYRVKASMQDAASSYSLPVMHQGLLTGLLFSYDSKDQICEIGSTEIMRRFLDSAKDGAWEGFPTLGVTTSSTEDTSLRQWLKLGDHQGGVYVGQVRKGSAAESAGILKGDVILSIDHQWIDRRGYCKHPDYGNLHWGHWIRGRQVAGKQVALEIWRAGKPLRIHTTLTGESDTARVVPPHMHDVAPNFLVKGGLVFQELSLPLLRSFGKDWESVAPLDLLDAAKNQEPYEGKVNRIVFLSGVIPTPATIGYEKLRNLIVDRVNGHAVKDLASLMTAFDSHRDPLHTIGFTTESLDIRMDAAQSDKVDAELLRRGIRKLHRTDHQP